LVCSEALMQSSSVDRSVLQSTSISTQKKQLS
jgi:hypothetical protein